MEPYRISADEALAALDSDARLGLSENEARARLERHGKNELTAEKPVPAWKKFLAQFADPLVILLLVATAISAALWLVERESALPYEAIAILAVVLLNALMGYIQESRAEQAVAALRRMSAAHASVVRGGHAAEHRRRRGSAGRHPSDRGGRHGRRRRARDPVDRAADRGGGAHRREHAGMRRTPLRSPRRLGSATAATWCSAARRRPTGAAGPWSPRPGCTPRWGALPAC